MVHREIIYSLIWCLLSFATCFPAEKLPLNQQKSLSVPSPEKDLIPVLLFKRGPRTIANPTISTNVNNDVEWKEYPTISDIDGKLVRIVTGYFSYKSPEGISIFVHYNADSNGNQGGFKLGEFQPTPPPRPAYHPPIIRGG
ncbi:PREDICTED: uncharacterized protein LOC106748980 [Dinoponera quadriceps]|uniref:Uncharacterized protein LOC106748980 n=1 Tax=Dinoponera quadriceps TaxID=609295 RepID=A0A6P3XZD6_DINQU|nr:PREDICTED: uncharacterized protein LOC106748980 [Dinoponera quadriceps]